MPAPRYQSLEDFLIANPLTVDGQLQDGWGSPFPVKGREIEATVLFADITAFSARTLKLTATETLAFVNNFFAWISAEALKETRGVVDKYIGDEVMIVFSREFGSDDPLTEAAQAARWMAEQDVHSFCPHIGIASGPVVVGYVGTPLKYNCSAFGSPVALAARCANLTPDTDDRYSSWITLPAADWGDRDIDDVFPPLRYAGPDGKTIEQPHGWKLLSPRDVELKNVGTVSVREIVHCAMYVPSQSAEDRAREGVRALSEAGLYRRAAGEPHHDGSLSSGQ